ncbi:MAG TPA: radical SAM protein [Candidatus Omnitrophota bacterium]|nr:B12-binding domain-containing radical SAM protein [Candidatus Omnitrophota bacterium]HQO58529.1 radical SAM protein [Candidatus Omnitrophota bacterium]
MMKSVYLLYIKDSKEGSRDYSGLMQTGLLKTVPKLGLQYLHAILQQNNFSVILWDQEIENFTIESLSAEFKKNPPLFIGLYSSEKIRNAVIYFIRKIRLLNPDLNIVVGGPDYFSYESYLQAGCSFVCCGEGEKTILDIARYAQGECQRESLKGVYYRDGEKIFQTSPQPLIENLDMLPFPIRQHWDQYADFHYLGMRKPYVHMMTSRGCGHACSYCSTPYVWGKIVRRRSLDNIFAEIAYLVEQCQVKYISFKDDRFFPDLEWLRAFCRELIRRKYPLRFNCSACPADFKDNGEEKLDLLKTAGCDALIFGLQSTDKMILKSIHRNPKDVDSLSPVIRYANTIQLFTIVEFIFGLPGDTRESLESAIRYALETKPYFVQFNQLMIFKGSELYSQTKKGLATCLLNQKQIRKMILQGYLRFYLNPEILYKNFRYIIKNNPRWFMEARHVYKYPFLGAYYYFLEKRGENIL